jgi:hypothetical protein
MGFDETDETLGATLPKRKGTVWFSALLGLRRMLLAEAAFGRKRTGLVTGRFRLDANVRNGAHGDGLDLYLLWQLEKWRGLYR